MHRFDLKIQLFLLVLIFGSVLQLNNCFARAMQARSGVPSPKEKPAIPDAKVGGARADLPSDFELLRTRYRFENDGTGRREVTARIRILNKMGALQRSEMTFDYKPFSEKMEIPYVRVAKKDGSIVKIIEGEVIERPKIPANAKAPNFDYDEKRIRVPGLSAGDVLEYQEVTVIQRPLAPGQFWAQYTFQPSVVFDEQLEIDVPAGRTVKVKSKPGIETDETGDSKTKIYHWRNLSLRLEDRQSVRDPWNGLPDIQLSSFANWEEVGRWYSGVEKRQRIPTPVVQAKAEELTKDLHSDLEKVEALYDFAAKQIRYISLASL
jgi:hypothetical protein